MALIEAQFGGKTLAEHFREQAELIDRRFLLVDQRFHQIDEQLHSLTRDFVSCGAVSKFFSAVKASSTAGSARSGLEAGAWSPGSARRSSGHGRLVRRRHRRRERLDVTDGFQHRRGRTVRKIGQD